MFTSPFEENKQPETPSIDPTADIIFVADMFAEDYAGGAELTSEALIKGSGDLKVQKLHARHVSMDTLSDGVDKYWVFGNFTSMNPNLIPSIVANMSYSILEYDYKFCQYRSIEKHKNEAGMDCDCPDQLHGKLMSTFFHGAKSIWWMSEEQEARYLERFPFLQENQRTVLSSVFNEDFFAMVQALKEATANQERKGWIVLGSDSWIKGAEDAIQYCQDNNLDYEVVWGLPHKELLAKLAVSEGFVYLPRGGDTCPRMVIEAKALGCEVIVNDDVQHSKEMWYTGSMEDMLMYLYGARERFWRGIKSNMEYSPDVSGYVTLLDASSMGYPWKACVNSMLGFCSEVIVADGGSTDGTWEEVQSMASMDDRIKTHQSIVDPKSPSYAYESDGKLKAFARSKCTGDYCWQMDADEVVHEDDYEKVFQMIRAFPKHIDIVSLPVVEYWGSPGKVRMDINPWKWRLSRNLPHITQGIPADCLQVDEDGYEYATMGTDSCDYIHADTRERLPHIGFYSEEVHNVRMAALQGNEEARKAYEGWFQNVVEQLPGVHHYSWYNMANKIRQYKKHWGKFWKSLYRHDVEDTAENNVMFDKPWAEVTEEEIDELASKLASQLGGWIFHTKVDLDADVPHISITKTQPKEFVKNPMSDISPLGCKICNELGPGNHKH